VSPERRDDAGVAELPVKSGHVAPVLREEFPGLALRFAVVPARPGRSPAGVKQRLRYLADRMHGQRALNMRREPIASAYRIFFRQIGLDPDDVRTPIEAAVLERLRAGGFKSHGLVEDAVTIATVETGVAMRALDADRIKGRLGLRLAQEDERLGGEKDGLPLPAGALVLADAERALALLFGEAAASVEADRSRTERLALCAIQVGGVPDISVEEAIWICAAALYQKDAS
jgi:DNA/RNA-binding domain of Phe-tRNA-synthetase-like protein